MDTTARRVRLPRGFAARLAVATSALVVVVCTAQSWLLARDDLGHVRGYLADRGHSLAAGLASEAGHALAAGDVEGVQRLVDQARAESGVVYARVLDGQGLLLAAAGQKPPSVAVTDATLLGADVWEFRAAIASGEEVSSAAAMGTVAVGLSLEQLHALRRNRLAAATFFAALSTLIGVLGAGILARALTSPLRTVVDAVDRISGGDFGARVAVSGDDEVGRLAGSFNVMAASLARSRAVLEEKVRELERADHLKSEFLATISHELRTPLNVILGFTEMLAEGAAGTLTPTQAEMIATIDRYSRDQLELISSVLDFSRLSSGRISLRIERFALSPLLGEIHAQQQARLRNPAVALTVVVAPDIGDVETDRIKLQEIVRNLVDNAVKFTEKGTIVVRAHATGPGWLAIDVEDSGPGIAAEDAEAIFDPFHQLGASSTRGTGGVGLGLSIVRQLAEGLGGRVSVASRLGEGSRFRVQIPCLVARAVDHESSVTAALDAAASNVAAVRGAAPTLRLLPSRTHGVRDLKG